MRARLGPRGYLLPEEAADSILFLVRAELGSKCIRWS